jgi:hypothetical protein
MTPSLLAILARFDGDPKQARDYCAIMALTYPALAEEYQGYAYALEEEFVYEPLRDHRRAATA